MAKIISIIALILLIILTPPAVLAYISQDAVPGDMTYPIKRTLEDGILLVASINPSTRAWFSVARSQRRFKEAQSLIAQGKNANKTLGELSTQINSAVADVSNVKSTSSKRGLITNLEKNVTNYELELKLVKEQLDKELLASETQSLRPSPAAPQINNQKHEEKIKQRDQVEQTIKDIEKAKKDIEKEKENLGKQIEQDLEKAAEGDNDVEIPGLSDEITDPSDFDKLFNELKNINVNEFLQIVPD